MWQILSGNKPRFFASQQKAQEAANRLGLSEPTEVNSSPVEPILGLEQYKNSPRSASAGQGAGDGARGVLPNSVGSSPVVPAEQPNDIGRPSGRLPALSPAQDVQGKAMPAQTDKLATAINDGLTALHQRAEELADQLNREFTDAHATLDSVHQLKDSVKNGFAGIRAAMSKFTNYPPSQS